LESGNIRFISISDIRIDGLAMLAELDLDHASNVYPAERISDGSLHLPLPTNRPRSVHSRGADELTDGENYEPVTCTACGRVHLINPKSGKVLESAEKKWRQV